MKSFLLILFSILYPIVCLSQGKLMLVGGGSERNGAWSWSNIPYRWAIDQSSNKKVAIISFSSSSDPNWLPDYFSSLGATAAANFVISTSEAANSQQTYDDLMAYVSCYSNEASVNRVTGMKNPFEPEASIPNPVVNGMLEIKNLPDQRHFNILIYNTKGSVVLNRRYNQTHEKVIISELPSDVYIVKLIGSDFFINKKVMVINQ